MTAKVGRETAGRRGKGVTTVFDVALDEDALLELAGKLKQRCGTGGTVKDCRIEIQGDQRERIVAELEKLGFKVQRVATSSGAVTPATATPTVPSPTPAPAKATPVGERKYEPQKQALLDLLKKRFSMVECEAEFPWLVVPKVDEMKEPLASIFQALRAMRGFSDFARAGRSLRCDFYIPKQRLIVKYDERHHFTIQRAKSLELYPADIFLEFDRKEWITACQAIKATDPSPPYRDEQRAFYDSLAHWRRNVGFTSFVVPNNIWLARRYRISPTISFLAQLPCVLASEPVISSHERRSRS